MFVLAMLQQLRPLIERLTTLNVLPIDHIDRATADVWAHLTSTVKIVVVLQIERANVVLQLIPLILQLLLQMTI
jgi:hypothetical protein